MQWLSSVFGYYLRDIFQLNWIARQRDLQTIQLKLCKTRICKNYYAIIVLSFAWLWWNSSLSDLIRIITLRTLDGERGRKGGGVGVGGGVVGIVGGGGGRGLSNLHGRCFLLVFVTSLDAASHVTIWWRHIFTSQLLVAGLALVVVIACCPVISAVQRWHFVRCCIENSELPR